MISAEARSILQQYEQGNFSNRQLAEWLVQVEYDSALPAEERDILARLRLVVLEAAEGRRSNDDVLDAVAGILALESPDKNLVTKRTSSSTRWAEPRAKVTEAATPALHVGTAT